jgi:hypothetical protein
VRNSVFVDPVPRNLRPVGREHQTDGPDADQLVEIGDGAFKARQVSRGPQRDLVISHGRRQREEGARGIDHERSRIGELTQPDPPFARELGRERAGHGRGRR